jgi:ribosome biogenesis protein UTP30
VHRQAQVHRTSTPAMAPSVESLVDMNQVGKAVSALKRYLGAQGGAELLDDEDEFLYLLISLKKSHPLQRSDKPLRIPVPHPIHDFEHSEVCLFVKDDKSGAGHKAAKKRLDTFSKRAGISKVSCHPPPFLLQTCSGSMRSR